MYHERPGRTTKSSHDSSLFGGIETLQRGVKTCAFVEHESPPPDTRRGPDPCSLYWRRGTAPRHLVMCCGIIMFQNGVDSLFHLGHPRMPVSSQWSRSTDSCSRPDMPHTSHRRIPQCVISLPPTLCAWACGRRCTPRPILRRSLQDARVGPRSPPPSTHSFLQEARTHAPVHESTCLSTRDEVSSLAPPTPADGQA